MRDELRVHHFLLDVPDGARGVKTRRADALHVGLVPVEAGERRANLAVLVVVQQRLELHAILLDVPDAEVISGGGDEIFLAALLVGDEQDLRARVRVRERVLRHGGEGAGLVVQGDDVHLVSVLLHERPDRQAESLVLAHLRDNDTVAGAGGNGA